MRVLVDTNILISAALFPKGVPAQAFFKAVTPPHHAVVCDYSMDEFRRVFNAKFPHKISDYERFVSIMALSVEIVTTPPSEESVEAEAEIRDVKDHPILRAAIASGVECILTGDKDFLESGVKKPSAITAARFMEF